MLEAWQPFSPASVAQRWPWQRFIALARRWWAAGLDHLAEELGADLGGGLVLGEGDVG